MNTMSLTTLERSKTTVDAAAIEALAAQLRGTLLQQGDAAYDEARTIWNAMIDRRPGLIVRCAGAADVISAVQFRTRQQASRRGARRRPQHCRQRRLRWRPDDRSVADEVGAGRSGGAARMGRSRARRLPMSTRKRRPSGWRCRPASTRPPAYAGLTLGGGFGWITRKFGLTIDNLVSADVVTADGELLRASADGKSGPVLGAARRRRQFRHRHRVRVPAAPGGSAGPVGAGRASLRRCREGAARSIARRSKPRPTN